MEGRTFGHSHGTSHCRACTVRSMPVTVVWIIVVVDHIPARTHTSRKFHVGCIDTRVNYVHVHALSREVVAVLAVQRQIHLIDAIQTPRRRIGLHAQSSTFSRAKQVGCACTIQTETQSVHFMVVFDVQIPVQEGLVPLCGHVHLHHRTPFHEEGTYDGSTGVSSIDQVALDDLFRLLLGVSCVPKLHQIRLLPSFFHDPASFRTFPGRPRRSCIRRAVPRGHVDGNRSRGSSTFAVDGRGECAEAHPARHPRPSATCHVRLVRMTCDPDMSEQVRT